MRALPLVAALALLAGAAKAAPLQYALWAQDAASPVRAQNAAAPAALVPAPKAKAKAGKSAHGKGTRHRAPSRSHGKRTLTGVLNLNDATAEQLAIFPGLGKSRARAVIAARPYVAAWEVGRVHAVGPAFYRKYEEHLRVDGPTNLAWLHGVAH